MFTCLFESKLPLANYLKMIHSLTSFGVGLPSSLLPLSLTLFTLSFHSQAHALTRDAAADVQLTALEQRCHAAEQQLRAAHAATQAATQATTHEVDDLRRRCDEARSQCAEYERMIGQQEVWCTRRNFVCICLCAHRQSVVS